MPGVRSQPCVVLLGGAEGACREASGGSSDGRSSHSGQEGWDGQEEALGALIRSAPKLSLYNDRLSYFQCLPPIW